MKYVVNVYGRTIQTENSVIFTDAETLSSRLQENLQNKFPADDFHSTFIDMDSGDNLTDYDQNLIEQIENGDLAAPLVTVNDEIAVHGDIDAETVAKWLERKMHT